MFKNDLVILQIILALGLMLAGLLLRELFRGAPAQGPALWIWVAGILYGFAVVARHWWEGRR